MVFFSLLPEFERFVLKELTDKTVKLNYCPLTNKQMRHPVLASDGYHYELNALLQRILNNQLKSPLTQKRITYIQYDLLLKKEIDAESPADHYPDYNKQWRLNLLKSLLPLPSNSWQQDIYKSSQTTLIVLCFILVATMKQHEELSPTLLLVSTLFMGGLDLSVRIDSNHRHGFFGKVYGIVSNPELLCEALCNLDPSDLSM